MPNDLGFSNAIDALAEKLKGMHDTVLHPDLTAVEFEQFTEQFSQLHGTLSKLDYSNLSDTDQTKIKSINQFIRQIATDCLARKDELEKDLVTYQNKKKINQTYG
jgi:hypothetical protein